MKKTRRLFALALAPAAAFAADEYEVSIPAELIAAIVGADASPAAVTITLTDDIALNNSTGLISFMDKDITVDLNGHALSLTSDGGSRALRVGGYSYEDSSYHGGSVSSTGPGVVGHDGHGRKRHTCRPLTI